MQQFKAVAKKEFVRFFTDKRLWITVIVLPGLLIFLLYSLMGGLLQNVVDEQQNYVYDVCVFNLPRDDFFSALTDSGYNVNLITCRSEEEAKSAVQDKDADIAVVFPENFLDKAILYNVGDGDAPNVGLYYNSSETESSTAYQIFVGYFDALESSLANKFDVNGGDGVYDLATQEDTTAAIFSQLFPMIMLMLLFSGCASVVPDSFAGEKERGTLATTLVTPVRRSNIVFGKVFSLACISLLSGISGFLGTVGALPQLLKAASGAVDASVYGVGDYFSLFLVIISVTLLFVTLISVTSAYAKNTKEASAFYSTLMILLMLCSVPSAIGQTFDGIWTAFAPIFNAVVCMENIFSFTSEPLLVALTVAVNLVFSALLVWVLSKMFRSEKIMFNG